MKLLLHIGTHKTATTSIQHFFALNRKELINKGFFYPKNISSAYVFNNLAPQIVNGQKDQTKKFIEDSHRHAEEKGAHTVIISAESFYAMTGFFHILFGKQIDSTAYFSYEEEYIRELRSYCDIFEGTQLVCCLRPQEDYATSLYNQLVKSVKGITDDYMGFLDRTSPIYDYAGHLDLWTKYFGKDNMTIIHFNDIKADPVRYFCKNFITPEIHNETTRSLHSNKRLSRDILEFKLKENEKPYNAAKAFARIQCYNNLSQEFPDQSKWQIFASLTNRQNFFERYETGNKHLENEYGLAELNTMSSTEESCYPGLSDEKRKAIESRLNQMLSSPTNRTSVALRSFIHIFTDRFKFIDRALDPVRYIRNALRLRLEGW